MRKMLVLLTAMGVLLAFGGGAQAAVFGVDVREVFGNGSQIVQVQGVIACSAGDEYFVRVNVFDGEGNEAIGRASGVCSGSPQTWSTGQVRSDSGFNCDELVGLRGQARSGGDQKSFTGRDRVGCVT